MSGIVTMLAPARAARSTFCQSKSPLIVTIQAITRMAEVKQQVNTSPKPSEKPSASSQDTSISGNTERRRAMPPPTTAPIPPHITGLASVERPTTPPRSAPSIPPTSTPIPPILGVVRTVFAGREEEGGAAPREEAADVGLVCRVLSLGNGRYGTSVSSYAESADSMRSCLLKGPEALGKALLTSVSSCLSWFTSSFMRTSLLVCAALLLSSFHLDDHTGGILHIAFQEVVIQRFCVLAKGEFCSVVIDFDSLFFTACLVFSYRFLSGTSGVINVGEKALTFAFQGTFHTVFAVRWIFPLLLWKNLENTAYYFVG